MTTQITQPEKTALLVADLVKFKADLAIPVGQPSPPPPPAAGAWAGLPVAAHQRIRETYGDPAMTDAAAPVTETTIPFRTWGMPILDHANGILYAYGGGHSDIHTSAVDVCDLKAIAGAMPWQQNLGPPFDQWFKRPHLEPLGETSYGQGGSEYMLYEPAHPNAWQVTAPHLYTLAFAHPTLGLVVPSSVPRNLSAPTKIYDSMRGIKSWSRTSGLWTAHSAMPDDSTDFMPTEWNPARGHIVCFCPGSDRTRTHVLEWSPGAGFVEVALLMAKNVGNDIWKPYLGGTVMFLGCAHWIGDDRYIVWIGNQPGPWGYNGKLWLWDHAAKTATDITSDSFRALFGAFNDPFITAVAPTLRKIFWLRGLDTAAPELYWSSFDAPGDIKRLDVPDNPAFRMRHDSGIYQGYKGAWYYDGYLYTVLRDPGGTYYSSNYASLFFRVAVS